MQLKDFKFLILFFIAITGYAQQTVSGTVVFRETNKPISGVKVYDKSSGVLAETNTDGFYQFETTKELITLVFFSFEYQVEEISINTKNTSIVNVTLLDLSETLSEVEITARKGL